MAELFSDIYGAIRGQEGHRSVSSDKFPREFTLGQCVEPGPEIVLWV